MDSEVKKEVVTEIIDNGDKNESAKKEQGKFTKAKAALFENGKEGKKPEGKTKDAKPLPAKQNVANKPKGDKPSKGDNSSSKEPLTTKEEEEKVSVKDAVAKFGGKATHGKSTVAPLPKTSGQGPGIEDKPKKDPKSAPKHKKGPAPKPDPSQKRTKPPEKLTKETTKKPTKKEEENKLSSEGNKGKITEEREPRKGPLFENSLEKRSLESGSFDNGMAAYDPQNVEGLNPETTDSIVMNEGKVKYNHLTYKKVKGIMYDGQCDVKLTVGKANFKAHREVLAEASDYFSAMFSHNMKEKQQPEIVIQEIDPKGFTEMLEYFYHGYIVLSPGNIEAVLEAARFFHVTWILEICCDFLVHHMCLENYTDVLRLADKFSLGDLRYEIFTFLGQNLERLAQQKDFFKTLSYDLLLQFLMEDIYIEAQELFVVEMIYKWMQEDPDRRKEQMLPLLRQVKFNIIDAEDLEALPAEVTSFKEIREAVDEAITYSYNVMAQCLKTGDAFLPRGAHTVVTVMYFSHDGNFILYRDPTKSGMTVEQLAECGLDTVDYHAMSQAKIGNFVYAAGGYDKDYSSSNRTFRFYPKYREWIEVAAMSQPRVSFSMCNSSTRLFALGGVQRSHVEGDVSADTPEVLISSVEMYEPEENSWKPLPDLPVHCYDLASVHYDNKLYACGGISTDPHTACPLPNLWCLDLANVAQGWVPKRDMLTARQGHSLVAHKGKLYAQGGYVLTEDFTFKSCHANEVYDIETDQWSPLAPSPDQFGHLHRHTAVLENTVYVLGGSATEAFLYTYEIDTDTWDQIEQIGPNIQKLAILDVAYPEG